jgi:integrase/recombinase XerD
MKSISTVGPIDYLIGEFQTYLSDAAGLQPATVDKWAFFVRLFLSAQFKPRPATLDIEALTAQVLLEFVLEQGQHYPPPQLQSLASALRSVCRFLLVTGRHSRDLSAALPSISGHHREDLPVYLSVGQLEQTLSGFDRRTVIGKRDYAIALCAARLGLRAGEIAQLSLDDVDWRNSQLRVVAPKNRRQRQLPLPAEVGQALVAYLRSAPPSGQTRAFFRTVHGQRPMRPGWLSERLGLAMAHRGVGPRGKKAHLLRRTFATHLVQRGVSLKAVADLLGHADLSTAQVYAKVNLPMLREVAQEWPGKADR